PRVEGLEAAAAARARALGRVELSGRATAVASPAAVSAVRAVFTVPAVTAASALAGAAAAAVARRHDPHHPAPEPQRGFDGLRKLRLGPGRHGDFGHGQLYVVLLEAVETRPRVRRNVPTVDAQRRIA